MMKGTIEKLIAERGYGFIQTGEKSSFFFHRNALVGVAYESLTKGQQVEFEVTSTPKGQQAVNVRLAGSETP